MTSWSVQVYGQVTDLSWWGTVDAATEEEAEVEAMRRWGEHHGKRDPQLMTSAHALVGVR
ncbi:MAG: hypothetical protein KGL39_58345 [Patescibacteria group bacterium]|nr:hypothetical protein [Patescibacteria group bacterium]